MKREKIALLLAYFEEQNKILKELFNELKSLKISDKKDTVYIGFLLHNLYCALEDLMEDIAKTFENTLDDTSKYHRELLKKMILNVKGIRPQLWSNDSFRLLDELRCFRHVFRHAYGYELDSKRVFEIQDKVIKNWQKVKKDIEKFQKFLEKNLEE
jgi:uncharacterized protein YutE (UPF0331/DUF86 family)